MSDERKYCVATDPNGDNEHKHTVAIEDHQKAREKCIYETSKHWNDQHELTDNDSQLVAEDDMNKIVRLIMIHQIQPIQIHTLNK